MYLAEATVNNMLALSSHHSSMFCTKALEFKSSISIEKENKRADGKNLLYVLSLGIHLGDHVTIITEGSDEYTAASTLADILESDLSTESI